jgi:periplasmic protein TonB
VSSQALSYRVPVEYPEYAVENCIEGYVRVTYMLSEEGQPINIEVLEAHPKGIFEEATRRNIKFWRNPEKAGEIQETTIEYSLEDMDDCNS